MGLLKACDFARMICEYMKTLPNCEVDDPKKVQKFLGLLDDEFKMGVEWAVKRKLIVIQAPAARPAPVVRSPVTSVSAFTEVDDELEMESEVA